jgi:hypothetical protein
MTNESRIGIRLADLVEGCFVGTIASKELIGQTFKQRYTFLHDSISYECSVETFPYIHRRQFSARRKAAKWFGINIEGRVVISDRSSKFSSDVTTFNSLIPDVLAISR